MITWIGWIIYKLLYHACNLRLFTENKILMLWGAFAIASAVFCFKNHSCIPNAENDNLKDDNWHFSYTLAQKKIIDSVFNIKNKCYGFNGNVLIGQHDSIFYARAFGYANFRSKDSLNLHHVFQLASVSKQFTAVAILQLYEKGRLKLSDTVQRFYPDFPYHGITIHQLLVHRSGLPNYLYFFQHIPTTYDTIITNQQVVLEMINKKPEAYYRPNQRYHYSNTGYALLAAIVEKVTGMRFNQYLADNIFKPLKMEHTFTFLDKDAHQQNMATGYLKYQKQSEDNYLDYVLGDKGIYTNVLDLFKWDQGLYKNIIINYDTLQLAFQPMGKPAYFKSNYGYGWRIFNLEPNALPINFHAGWWHGFKSLLVRIPSDSTTAIILRNRSTGGGISTKSFLRLLYPPNPNTLSLKK